MWHKIGGKQGPWVRSEKNYCCQVYRIANNLWRWEVFRWHQAAGRFELQRLGTQPSLWLAVNVAECYVEAEQGMAP